MAHVDLCELQRKVNALLVNLVLSEDGSTQLRIYCKMTDQQIKVAQPQGRRGPKPFKISPRTEQMLQLIAGEVCESSDRHLLGTMLDARCAPDRAVGAARRHSAHPQIMLSHVCTQNRSSQASVMIVCLCKLLVMSTTTHSHVLCLRRIHHATSALAASDLSPLALLRSRDVKFTREAELAGGVRWLNKATKTRLVKPDMASLSLYSQYSQAPPS
jgi:hypothetical protein